MHVRSRFASFGSALFVGSLLIATSACTGIFGDKPLLDFRTACTSQADCADYAPPFGLFYDKECNAASCSVDGYCKSAPRAGTLPDDLAGDCMRPTCMNGGRTSAPDDSDVPVGSECRPGTCSPYPSYQYIPDGTECSFGVCKAGECVPAPPDADAAADAAAFDASDDASDAGDGGD